jgi:hypothetical protein
MSGAASSLMLCAVALKTALSLGRAASNPPSVKFWLAISQLMQHIRTKGSIMSKAFMFVFAVAGLLVSGTAHSPAAEPATGLDPLQGKWSVTKTNEGGVVYSQVIEFKKDQFVFRIAGSNGQVRLFAKGKAKVERAGPFDVLTVSDIEAGRSPEDLQSVDENRAGIYALRNEKLYLASNFDKDRENQRPTVDTYVRSEAPKETGATLFLDEKLPGEAKLPGTSKGRGQPR